jgi:Bifunctional DNA primase/polymerase, N-terminal/Primase C terminal 1 (PriCT-1)
MTESTSVLETAIGYVRRGWRVVPFYEPLDGGCSCSKRRGCESPGKHPRVSGGIHAATSEETRIVDWFRQWPGANLAVATGGHLVVLDVDPRHGGAEQLQSLFASHDYVSIGPWVETGGGGKHLYFSTIKPCRSRQIAPGLELKAQGAAVVAPPSRHVTGASYKWAVPSDLALLPEIPSWLTAAKGPDGHVVQDYTSIAQGTRHSTLLCYAGALRRVGASQEAILVTLATENTHRCKPPLSDNELRSIVAGVMQYPSNSKHEIRSEPDCIELAGREWPAPPAPAAFHGVAGEFVACVDPHTEADPVGLLAQFLAYIGNLIGRSPYFRVEASRHHSNIFPVLVGVSSKSRKGSSEAHVRGLSAEVDAEWARCRILSGLSSGEGLIWQVRDPISRAEQVKERGKRAVYQQVETDPGISDKRLLVLEPEMASVLRVQERQGSMLSSIIRDAWDRGDLGLLTKNSPARATAAHVTIVGHVTRDELLRYLTLTETANGFANRFLWLCVRRSKLLPEGGQLDPETMDPLLKAVRTAVDFARGTTEVRRDDESRRIWHEVYPSLSEGRHGLYGAVTSRAEAQVVRLSLLYALLDQSAVIRSAHLSAALALWEYADASARYIFGASVGDPTADRILRALRSAAGSGLNRTEISEHFSKNQTASQIEQALAVLEEQGLARRTRPDSQKGRPGEVWTYVGNSYERNEKTNGKK